MKVCIIISLTYMHPVYMVISLGYAHNWCKHIIESNHCLLYLYFICFFLLLLCFSSFFMLNSNTFATLISFSSGNAYIIMSSSERSERWVFLRDCLVSANVMRTSNNVLGDPRGDVRWEKGLLWQRLFSWDLS